MEPNAFAPQHPGQGVPFPPEPKPSAVVILHRDGEVFLVQRPKTASFFPGFHAFPGGGVEPEDEGGGGSGQDAGGGDELATLRACAVRELEEETLVALEPDALRPAGVVVTPPFSPIRFRTQFFLARLPAGIEPAPQRPELAGGRWTDPGRVLEEWRRGEIKLPPPVIHTLELLAGDGEEAILARGTEVDRFPITFLPGLRVEPLEVGTLPPHTHTNAFLVGEEDLAIVDPGASGTALEPLLAVIEQLEAKGHELTHVLLTHHHEDHVAGVDELVERFDALLACSKETADALGFTPDQVLSDLDQVSLEGTEVIALETPGHAPGHLCFHIPHARTVLVGDLLAGVGTVLIPPGEGDMAAYLASLDRLAGYCEEHGVRLAFPAHGPPLFNPVKRLAKTREHRLEREQRVLDAVREGARELGEIAKLAYEDKPEAPPPLTEMSTRAHLDKLVDDGVLGVEDERWAAR